MLILLGELWGDQDGVTSVEYSLLLALIVAATLVSWKALGCDVGNTVWRVVGRLPDAANR